MNIQDELQKIHHQFGTSEKANYEIQKLFDKQKKQSVGYTVLAAVPYQCCPSCNGNGQKVADGFTSSVYQTCKICNGAGIIPMHIVDWRFTVKA